MATTETTAAATVSTEKNMTAFEKVRFYIPDHLPKSDRVIDEVCRRLSELYGGATAIESGAGYWVDDDGELIEDSVTLVESLAEEVDTTDLEMLAGYIKATLNEDAVLFEIEPSSAKFV